MTDEELAAIEARAKETLRARTCALCLTFPIEGQLCDVCIARSTVDTHSPVFMVGKLACDIPALIAEVRRLREMIADMNDAAMERAELAERDE